MELDELIELKTKPLFDNGVRLHHVPPQEYYIKEIQQETDMQKLMSDEGGWVKETRGKHFLHKKSGTGGGHIT